jgi:hemoglobin
MSEPRATADSLYRRLGGHEMLAAIVDLFSRRVAADPALAPLFEVFAPESLRRRLTARLADVFGGPAQTGGTIELDRLLPALTSPQFELVVAHLAAALRTCGVPEATGTEALARVAALRDQLRQAEAG